MIRPGFREILVTVRQRQDAALPEIYTVRAGDNLSEIAQAKCRNGNDWTGIYEASHLTGNANIIEIGQKLDISCEYLPAELSKATVVEQQPVLTSVNVTAQVQQPSSQGSTDKEPDMDGDEGQQQHQAPAYQPQQSGGGGYGQVSPSNYSGFQQCVVARESGGQSQVMNSTGHYGLYQFDYGTWVSGGGNPADFGHASVAEQNGVFQSVYAARGTEPWAPSDGC